MEIGITHYSFFFFLLTWQQCYCIRIKASKKNKKYIYIYRERQQVIKIWDEKWEMRFQFRALWLIIWWSLKNYMVINFRACGISRGIRKLTRIPTSIIKKNSKASITIQRRFILATFPLYLSCLSWISK